MNPIRPILLSITLLPLLAEAQVAADPMKADTLHWDTVVNPRSFASYAALEASWRYGYPWGRDHNGSARMYAGPDDHAQLLLEPGSLLHIKADYITREEGHSSSPPHQPIRYHSAALYARDTIIVSNAWPCYEVSGAFKAPTEKGSWPAFWLTSARRWPPELDILEFKGNDTNWQNTFHSPEDVSIQKTAITNAGSSWHRYKAVLRRVNATDVDIHYYIDDKPRATHRCHFMNEPMWLIINLQMEGSSGSPGPTGATHYYCKDILVRRTPHL